MSHTSPPPKDFNVKVGCYGIDFDDTTICSNGTKQRIDFRKLLLSIFPGDANDLQHLSKLIRACFKSKMKNQKKKIHTITLYESLVFLGIILMTWVKNVPGGNLWKIGRRSEEYRDRLNMARNYMPTYRFKEIKHFVSYLWDKSSLDYNDAWW